MADVGDVIGDLHLATVVINVQDMKRAVDFWTAALGYVRREQEWDPAFMMLVDPAGRRLPVSLQLADSPPREPVRVHLDLYTRCPLLTAVPGTPERAVGGGCGFGTWVVHGHG